MNPQAKQLYYFLAACSGNWRNCIYIKCLEIKDGPGYLLASDRDGQPVIMAVQQFYEPTGVWIDPIECCGQLTELGFEDLYPQYLLWCCPSAKERPLHWLSQTVPIKP